MPRDEPGAWCERKVDTLPGEWLKPGRHELAPRMSPPAPAALREGGNSRDRMSLRLGYGAMRPSTCDSNQVSEKLAKAVNEGTLMFPRQVCFYSSYRFKRFKNTLKASIKGFKETC